MKPRRGWLLSLLAALLAGCAPGGPALGPEDARGTGATRSEPGRTLVAAIRVEPGSVASKGPRDGGVALHLSKRLFNAQLAVLDDGGRPLPYLAAELPRLSTDTWRVFADGRMETVYRLRPGATWHDGTPLSAEDFVFAWRVYSVPDFGFAGSPPLNTIEAVTAPDESTLLIRWRRPYPQAGALEDDDFPALPRHLLESAFGGPQDQPDAFFKLPYWGREYVGLGPYRLDRWEPGAFIEGTAFEGHILGRPKIERIKLVFLPDANAALANLLAGEVHLSADTSLRLEQVATLKREWGPENKGAVILHVREWRATYFQSRPELAFPPSVLDPRVRRALAHTVDKQGLNEALYGGEGVIADSMIPSTSRYGEALESAIARYPYDPARAEQLMMEAGFTRQDGFYTSASQGRLIAELKTNAAADNEAEMAIMASSWRQAGFDIQEVALPAAQAQDNQVRSQFPAMYTNNVPGGEAALPRNTTAEITGPGNRWRGANRAGWSSPQYDRLAEAFSATLDPQDRISQVVQMAKIYTEELPAISLFFRAQPWAHVAGLRGPRLAAPESNIAWDINQWEFR